MNIRCDLCGRFMSYASFYGRGNVTWTDYGHSTDMEPPDAKIAHMTCWRKLSNDVQYLIREFTWQKPMRTGNGELI